MEKENWHVSVKSRNWESFWTGIETRNQIKQCPALPTGLWEETTAFLGRSLCFSVHSNISGNSPLWTWKFLKPTTQFKRKTFPGWRGLTLNLEMRSVEIKVLSLYTSAVICTPMLSQFFPFIYIVCSFFHARVFILILCMFPLSLTFPTVGE